MTCQQADAEFSQSLSCSIIDSVRKTNPLFFVAIDEMAYLCIMIPFMEYDPRRPDVLCSHGKEPSDWISFVAVIASSGVRITALQEWSGNRSKSLDVFSRLDLSFGACFIMDNIAFHICSIYWGSVRLHAQRTA